MAQPQSGRSHKFTEWFPRVLKGVACKNCLQLSLTSSKLSLEATSGASMGDQPQTSLRSPCTIPSIGWRSVTLAASVLWSSGNAFSRVMNNGLGLFFMIRLGPLVPVKGNLNGTAYNDILDDSVLPTLWQQFGEGLFLFQHDNAPVRAQSKQLDCPAQSPDLNPIKHLCD